MNCPFLRTQLLKNRIDVNNISVENFLKKCDYGSQIHEMGNELNYKTEDWENLVVKKLDDLKRIGNYRTFRNVNRNPEEFPYSTLKLKTDGHTLEDSRVQVWCSNDYLGMGLHPGVIAASAEAATQYGAGSGGTRNISGTNNLHVQLEKELAVLHGKPGALLFGSCYAANLASISAMVKALSPLPVTLFSDEKNHASLIHGIKDSQAAKRIFRHNDVTHLESLLAETRGAKIIIFESVYSMDGTISPIESIVSLAKRHHALTFLDEVHAVGLYGESGGGVSEELGLLSQIDVISGTLGKAFGTFGGYVAGSALWMDIIRSFSPPFIFTTSLPPPVVGAAHFSVHHVRTHHELRLKQRENVRRLKGLLREANLPLLDNPSHLCPVMVGDAIACRSMADELLKKDGLYLQPINHPTVSMGTERFRITPNPFHTEDQLVHLVKSLYDVFDHHQPPSMKETYTFPVLKTSKAIDYF